jgi:hypothetical protein
MLRVEVCAILAGGTQTVHLLPDLQDFVILPGTRSLDNIRVFKVSSIHASSACYGINWEALFEDYRQGNVKIRVRVHGLHSISGLGRAIEHLTPAT